MSDSLETYITGLAILAVNIATMYMTFPCKRSLRFYLSLMITFSIVLVTFMACLNLGLAGKVLSSLAFLPVLIALFRTEPLQVVFAFVLLSLLAALQNAFAEIIAKYAFPNGGVAGEIMHIILLLCFLTVYLNLIFRYGRRIFERLFVNGRRIEWALYSFAAILVYTVMTLVRTEMDGGILYVALLLFILWNFAILCFAIINTHEKTKQRLDAEFARSIVSSGRDHYRKMNTMYEKIRMLRHDYKYHLSAALKMLHSGDAQSADEYLTGLEAMLEAPEVKKYCRNSVINALVAGYAERCERAKIKFNVCIDIPEAMSIPNYDLCIIIGNLLENAVEACEKTAQERFIGLETRNTSTHLLLMVQNSYNGEITLGGEARESTGYPVSTKANGGIGLKSVQEVVFRNGGTLTFRQDEAAVSAYASVRM